MGTREVSPITMKAFVSWAKVVKEFEERTVNAFRKYDPTSSIYQDAGCTEQFISFAKGVFDCMSAIPQEVYLRYPELCKLYDDLEFIGDVLDAETLARVVNSCSMILYCVAPRIGITGLDREKVHIAYQYHFLTLAGTHLRNIDILQYSSGKPLYQVMQEMRWLCQVTKKLDMSIFSSEDFAAIRHHMGSLHQFACCENLYSVSLNQLPQDTINWLAKILAAAKRNYYHSI